MKKYFIYITTNLITNEKYIGKHYGTEDDSYLGSGKILQRAILKYGKENFKREISYIYLKMQKKIIKKKKNLLKYIMLLKTENFIILQKAAMVEIYFIHYLLNNKSN